MLRIIINKIGTDYNGDILEIISGCWYGDVLQLLVFPLDDLLRMDDLPRIILVYCVQVD